MYRIQMRTNVQAFLKVFKLLTHDPGTVFLRAQRMTDQHAYGREKESTLTGTREIGAENLPQILGHVLDV